MLVKAAISTTSGSLHGPKHFKITERPASAYNSLARGTGKIHVNRVDSNASSPTTRTKLSNCKSSSPRAALRNNSHIHYTQTLFALSNKGHKKSPRAMQYI